MNEHENNSMDDVEDLADIEATVDAETADESVDDVFGDDAPVVQEPIAKELLRKIIEGVLMAAGQPMNEAKIAELFEGHAQYSAPEKDEIKAALEDIQADCMQRGFELKEVGSGWRFQVRAETAPWVNRLWDEKPQKYSRALLETLSLIAYRQPITRGDIEEIRGVAVSSHIVKTLSEREWIKVVGHRDVPGRPSLYATTRQFLDYFNLKSLDELPSLSELRDIEELDKEFNNELDLGDDADTEEAEGIKEAVAEFAELEENDASAELGSADLFSESLAAEKLAEPGDEAVHDQADETTDAEADALAFEDAVDADDMGEPAFEISDHEPLMPDVSATESTDEDPNAV